MTGRSIFSARICQPHNEFDAAHNTVPDYALHAVTQSKVTKTGALVYTDNLAITKYRRCLQEKEAKRRDKRVTEHNLRACNLIDGGYRLVIIDLCLLFNMCTEFVFYL